MFFGIICAKKSLFLPEIQQFWHKLLDFPGFLSSIHHQISSEISQKWLISWIFDDIWAIIVSFGPRNAPKMLHRGYFFRGFSCAIRPDELPAHNTQAIWCGWCALRAAGLSRKCPEGAGFLGWQRKRRTKRKKLLIQRLYDGCALWARSLRSLAVNTQSSA